MHNALHHKKNVKPCCTQGNGEVDCNVPNVPSVIPLGFNGTIRIPKVYYFFMFLQKTPPPMGVPNRSISYPKSNSLTAAQIITEPQNG